MISVVHSWCHALHAAPARTKSRGGKFVNACSKQLHGRTRLMSPGASSSLSSMAKEFEFHTGVWHKVLHVRMCVSQVECGGFYSQL